MTRRAVLRSSPESVSQSTSTPLQALTLLNDPQIVEAARFVAQRMLKEGGETTDSQLAWAFRLITSRPPTASETAILMQMYSEQRADFAADQEAAKKLLAVGEAKPDATRVPADLAAGTVVALAILNHDEAVNRR